jgi:hypothetical protein
LLLSNLTLKLTLLLLNLAPLLLNPALLLLNPAPLLLKLTLTLCNVIDCGDFRYFELPARTAVMDDDALAAALLLLNLTHLLLSPEKLLPDPTPFLLEPTLLLLKLTPKFLTLKLCNSIYCGDFIHCGGFDAKTAVMDGDALDAVVSVVAVVEIVAAIEIVSIVSIHKETIQPNQ